MTAQVIDFRAFKAREMAIQKAERVRELAEHIHEDSGGNHEDYEGTAYTYAEMGWATDSEITLAMAMLADALDEASEG